MPTDTKPEPLPWHRQTLDELVDSRAQALELLREVNAAFDKGIAAVSLVNRIGAFLERNKSGSTMSIYYIGQVKRALIEQHGFPENPDKPGCVLGEVPDGIYPCTIDGRVDNVEIKNGYIGCCNFGPPLGPEGAPRDE